MKGRIIRLEDTSKTPGRQTPTPLFRTRSSFVGLTFYVLRFTFPLLNEAEPASLFHLHGMAAPDYSLRGEKGCYQLQRE